MSKSLEPRREAGIMTIPARSHERSPFAQTLSSPPATRHHHWQLPRLDNRHVVWLLEKRTKLTWTGARRLFLDLPNMVGNVLAAQGPARLVKCHAWVGETC